MLLKLIGVKPCKIFGHLLTFAPPKLQGKRTVEFTEEQCTELKNAKFFYDVSLNMDPAFRFEKAEELFPSGGEAKESTVSVQLPCKVNESDKFVINLPDYINNRRVKEWRQFAGGLVPVLEPLDEDELHAGHGLDFNEALSSVKAAQTQRFSCAHPNQANTPKEAVDVGDGSPEAVRELRGSVYGNVKAGHAALGKTWAGILSDHFQHDIPDLPAHVAALMLAALKLNRAAKPFKFNADNYVDARNYLDFAEETDPRNGNS